jgi:type II secretory pathway pseudopilin PulG
VTAPTAIRRARGFTLTELAVVFTIIAFLLAAGLYTLSAQTEQRNFEETRQRLETARELLIGFAQANGRLPCPATSTSGDEAMTGADCTITAHNGFLPARALGFSPVNDLGLALDAWGNPLRYAVARHATNPTGSTVCSPNAVPPGAFTNRDSLRVNGLSCAPLNLVVCSAAQNTSDPTPGSVPPTCGTWNVAGDARPLTNQRSVVAVLLSVGKNFAVAGAGGADETANQDGNGVFVLHEPRPAGAAGGEFDDQMTWIAVGELYGRMVAGGLLP